MKNRFIVVYTIFAAAIFVFSLSFFVYNLYNEYTTNKKNSTEDFNQLITDIRTISNKYNDNSSAFSEELKKTIKSPQEYAFLEIKRDDQQILLYPAGKTIHDTKSNMTRTFEFSISTDSKTLVINCNRYLIQPDSIFYYARISFLMILIITLITIIMIIYLNISENKTTIAEESDEISDTEQTVDEINDVAETNESVNVESDNVIKEEPSSTDAASSEHEDSDTTESSETSEPSALSETSASSGTSETAVSEEPAELPINEVKPASPSPETIEAANENPSGLYNPKTEIGWESYLVPRLNNEIDRATASEIDLAIFEFKLPELSKDNEEFTNVCRYLTLQFQFKDLLFEYKEDSIIAIKISMNIDSAITFADKLFGDIRNIIDGKKCYIGISSRSIRIVTAERLLLEADQAVIHAIEDKDSPVVAFRVDSNKYRELMEQNQG